MSTVATILSKKGHDIATVTENDTALKAAQLMREKHIGSVIVLRVDTVVGIFTERDVMYRVVAGGRNPYEVTVGEVMTTPVESCTPEMPLKDVATTMTSRRLRHMPVIDDGRLVGVITSGDILAHKITHLEESNIFLQEYLHGAQA